MIVLFERQKHLDLQGKDPINVCAHALYVVTLPEPDTCTREPKEGVLEKPQHQLLICISAPQVRGGAEVLSYMLWPHRGACW